MDARIGAVIDGRYKLLQVLGSGGMGVVYRAQHLLLRKELALKLLHTHLQNHPRGAELKQRFLREAQSLARLDRDHPHIVYIADCGISEDGTLYMAMELCQGEPLCAVIARGPLPPARALHIGVQVLRALVHAHKKGIVHRDLKPDNILLTQQGERRDFVKVLDFGIAKLLHEAELEPGVPLPPIPAPGGAALTHAGLIFGTPEYLAPEQAQGLPVDPRTDLYAVGVMLWEMLTGRRPFLGQEPLQIITQHLTERPDPPSHHSPYPLPPALDEVVLRAMAKQPEERFASAEEFLRALDVVLDQLTPPGTPSRLLTPLLNPLRRAVSGDRPGSAPPAPAPQGVSRPGLTARLLAAVGRLGVRETVALVVLVLLLAIVTISRLAVHLSASLARRPPPAPAPQPTAPPQRVPLEEVLAVLQHSPSCPERRSAVLELIARRDAGALEGLKRAARAPAPLRACMQRELDEAIALLSPGPPQEDRKAPP